MESKGVKYTDFLQLLLKNQEKLYGFIFALVPDFSRADDIMQEAILAMWSKFDTFRKGSSFYAWAVQIARHKVFHYREKMSGSKVIFSSEALDNILSNAGVFEEVDIRMNALERCLEKLRAKDRELIRKKYIDSKTIRQIAEEAGRSVAGLYKVMARIHSKLQDCINKTLAEMEVV